MSKILPLVSRWLLTLALLVLAASPAWAHGLLVVDDPAAAPTVRVPRPPTPAPLPRPAGPVTLEDHRVRARVDGPVADVTVEQVFRSHADRQLEGTYLFPLPEGATVAKFAMTMGGRMVEGEIVEAEQARRIYEDIVRRRRDPGLLEYMGRGLFRARVFPIEPHKDLTIRLTFQQILPEDAGTLEWRYPLATSRLHAEPVANVIVDVEVVSDVDLKALYCPSHDVAIVRDTNRRARVSYERAGRTQDRDFLLYVGRSPADVGFSVVSHKAPGEDGTFLAVLAPSAVVRDAKRAPKDVVFVLDTSGSMAQDGKIEQARKALEYGIRTLQAGDRFNVIAFATQVRPFRERLVDANPETKDAGVRWVQELTAAGGTNIEGALQEALRQGEDGRLHLVVFVTDGRPTIGERDTNRLAKLVEAKGEAPVRVFTFGVGFDLDVQLLDRIAEATRATRDYVMPEEDLEIATGRFFKKVSQPVMTDLAIELGSGVHEVYPSRLPDLFAGDQIVILGRYDQPGDRLIRLTGKIGSEARVLDFEATFGGAERAPYLARLWAHRKVGYLLDEIRLHGEERELVDEVIRLATRYGIVTPYTAGLVLEEGELLGGARTADHLAVAERRRAEVGRSLRPGGLVPLSGAASTPAPGAPAPAEAPAQDGKAARDSERLRRLKDEASGAEAEESGDLAEAQAKVKAIEDKTFLLDAQGRWVDTAWDGKAETVKVDAFSDAWMRLIAELTAKHGTKVARYLAAGERVVFVLGGQAYEITLPQ